MGRLLCGHNIVLLTPSYSVEEKLRLLQNSCRSLLRSRSKMEGSFCLSMSLKLNVSLNVCVQILTVVYAYVSARLKGQLHIRKGRRSLVDSPSLFFMGSQVEE